MLRLIKLLVVLSLLLVIALPLALLVAGLQPRPLVPLGASPTSGDVSRAKALLKRLDPRGQTGGDIRTIEVPERDLAFALDYAVGRLLSAGADVDLHRGGATVSITAELPPNPLGRFYNLRLDLAQVPGGIDVEGLRIGEVAVPEPIAKGLGWLARTALQRDETVRVMLESVNGYRLTDDRLVVLYQWRPELVDRVKSRGRALLVDEADRERLLSYTARIAATTRKGLLPGRMPLGDLLQPVFQEARSRTGTAGEAAAENRAAIVALMLYVQGVDVARFLDEPADARYRSRARTFTLRGRTDFVHHFLISAGIAAAAGSASRTWPRTAPACASPSPRPGLAPPACRSSSRTAPTRRPSCPRSRTSPSSCRKTSSCGASVAPATRATGRSPTRSSAGSPRSRSTAARPERHRRRSPLRRFTRSPARPCRRSPDRR